MTGLEVALFAGVLGSLTSAVGAVKQGQNAKAVGKYNAKLAENNAVAARATAKENASREARLGMKRMGALRASGASLDVLEDNALEEELNLLTILHGGESRAIGEENTARLDRARGDAAASSSLFTASGELLKGGAKAFSVYDASPRRVT